MVWFGQEPLRRARRPARPLFVALLLSVAGGGAVVAAVVSVAGTGQRSAEVSGALLGGSLAVAVLAWLVTLRAHARS